MKTPSIILMLLLSFCSRAQETNQEVNQEPNTIVIRDELIIEPIPLLKVSAGKAIEYQILATSNIYEPLMYELHDAPICIGINEEGLLSISPIWFKHGFIDFDVIVSSGDSKSKEKVMIQVQPEDS